MSCVAIMTEREPLLGDGSVQDGLLNDGEATQTAAVSKALVFSLDRRLIITIILRGGFEIDTYKQQQHRDKSAFSRFASHFRLWLKDI